MRTLLLASLALGMIACPGPGAGRPAPAPADLAVTGGTIYTMDPLRPRAEALAIRDGRIAAVGSAAEIRQLIGPRTRVIDLAGGSATPGLVDAHSHLYGLGQVLAELAVKGQTSKAAIAQLVAEVARSRPAGEWIVGSGWDQNLWTPAVFPDHAVLDAAAPDHPVMLYRVDGHAAWLNARALAAAGITRATVDPPGGSILRDAAGEPTGVLIDRAMGLASAALPADNAAARERKILAAARLAVSRGLTGVHEMGIDDDTVAVYRDLVARGLLPLRVYALLRGEGALDTLAGRTPDRDLDGTAMFTLRAVKLFADGALGSRGALLAAPYSDAPETHGLELTSAAELRRAVALCVASGFQLAVHAIGDAANHAVLDAFATAAAPRAQRFRVEHAQVLLPADVVRFGELGVIASMQPTHATSDMAWAPARLGPERTQLAYAWQSLRTAKADLAFGSDFPIEEVGPLLGLYAAVTRQDAAGQPPGGFLPGERLTLDEALRAFTVGPAHAGFVEGRRGVLVVGAVADVTAFDRELRPDASLLTTKVLATIVGGQVVYAQTSGRTP